MILRFSVGNYQSIRDVQILDLQPSKKKPKYSFLNDNVATIANGERALKVKVVYGANGSGKSNLLRGLGVFRHIVINSFADNLALYTRNPFLFDARKVSEPTFFEIIIDIGERIFRYGFEADHAIVFREWLYEELANKQVKLFERHEQDFTFVDENFPGTSLLQKTLEDGVNPIRIDALLLTVGGALNIPLLSDILQAIKDIQIVLQQQNTPQLKVFAMEKLSNTKIREAVVDLLVKTDIGINGIRVDPTFDTNGEKKSIIVSRPFFEPTKAETSVINWPLDANESEGTKRLTYLAPLIVETLHEGSTIIIDEFESQLHTNLSRAIVEMFNGKATNPNNAQLIIATHDTNLLTSSLLRRDQVAFVEKTEELASEVYSLSDLKGIRNDDSYEKSYLIGKFSAVPDLDQLTIFD